MKDPLTGANLGTIKEDGKVHEPDALPLEEWRDRGGEDILLAGPRTDHGDFPFRLFIRLRDHTDNLREEEIKEFGGHLEVEILCASIEAAGDKAIVSALQCCGEMTPAEMAGQYDKAVCEQISYESLIDYGTYARLWSEIGTDEEELMAKAKSQIRAVNMLFGFYMDKPQNRIGATGWDFIRGNLMPERERDNT